MYLKTILLLLSFSSVAFTKEVQVHYDNYRYNISYDKNSVAYSGHLVNLSLKKAPCNEHLIEKFNLLMEKMLSEKFAVTPMKDSFQVTIDKKDFYESKTAMRAVFFRDFDRLFKQVKTEEFVNCEGTKKK